MYCRGVQAGYVNEFIKELCGVCSYSVMALQELIIGSSEIEHYSHNGHALIVFLAGERARSLGFHMHLNDLGVHLPNNSTTPTLIGLDANAIVGDDLEDHPLGDLVGSYTTGICDAQGEAFLQWASGRTMYFSSTCGSPYLSYHSCTG